MMTNLIMAVRRDGGNGMNPPRVPAGSITMCRRAAEPPDLDYLLTSICMKPVLLTLFTRTLVPVFGMSTLYQPGS